MELALYFPKEGYYERPIEIGKKGDFFTSVSVGNLFGELLAFQFAEWFCEEKNAPRFQIIEAGAHDGQLGFDILTWLKKHHPQICETLEYWIVEPSEARQLRQTKLLEDFAGVYYAADFSGFSALDNCFRIIFSNELLDAMPVHRLGWDALRKIWFEWGVAFDGTHFVWKKLSRATTIFPTLPQELLQVLPDEFVTEVCPAATQWWMNAANILERGKLIGIDYGLSGDEFFSPERSKGTLRAFSRHHANSYLLESPGEQDITAHVNFSELQRLGERAGLKTDEFIWQRQFLTKIAEKSFSRADDAAEWDAVRRRQFQTLIHPEHLGRGFRVLIQSRSMRLI
ncbi:MAG: SAM-dependent methyltransferase [Verrucomicrobiota bacterium]